MTVSQILTGIALVIVVGTVMSCAKFKSKDAISGPTYWIQNSDFSMSAEISETEPVHSAEQILEALENYDWRAQNTYEDKCLKQKSDCAPAGLGLVARPGVILHICPRPANQQAMVHLHINGQSATYVNVPDSYYPEIVKLFLDENYSEVSTTLESFKS